MNFVKEQNKTACSMKVCTFGIYLARNLSTIMNVCTRGFVKEMYLMEILG